MKQLRMQKQQSSNKQQVKLSSMKKEDVKAVPVCAKDWGPSTRQSKADSETVPGSIQ